MNTFEKCLLLDSLVKTGNRKDAGRLFEHIKYHRDADESQNDVENQNRIFDIVLNLNMVKAEGASGARVAGLDLLGEAGMNVDGMMVGGVATGFSFGGAAPSNSFGGAAEMQLMNA